MRKAWLVTACLVSTPGVATARDFSISSGASLSSGRYGGADETRVSSSSLSLRSDLAGWQLGVTLPYLTIENGGDEAAVAANGFVVQPGQGRKRQSGYGDVQLRVERALPSSKLWPIETRIAANFKLPTGARRLSTGKVDTGVSVEFSRQFGRVTPYVSAGYRTFGDIGAFRLRDGWATSAGATVALRKVTFIASYERSNALVFGPAPREIFGVATGPLAPGLSWSVFGSKGLSAGSANLMVGTSITRSFGR